MTSDSEEPKGSDTDTVMLGISVQEWCVSVVFVEKDGESSEEREKYTIRQERKRNWRKTG